MRYSFLLDENIIYHAARGVDKHDNPDETAAELVRSIARICHGITIHKFLFDRYWQIVQKLKSHRSSASEALSFISLFMVNPAKRTLEYGDLPELPAGVQIPRKDADIVRAALISHPIIVTADERLRDAIKSQPMLGLTALSPKEALEFAKSNPVG